MGFGGWFHPSVFGELWNGASTTAPYSLGFALVGRKIQGSGSGLSGFGFMTRTCRVPAFSSFPTIRDPSAKDCKNVSGSWACGVSGIGCMYTRNPKP